MLNPNTMKKNYLFLLLTIAFFQVKAQSNCADAYQDLVYAYSHVKSAYDSNNKTHLQHYSERSLEAFENTKKVLENCDCEKAYNLAYDASDLLSKVAYTETFEDGRFYVKRAREIAKETINELEICTKVTDEDSELAELQSAKLNLEQQRIALQLKEEEIKLKMAEQAQKELKLTKEELISNSELAVSTTINSYNDMMSACGCSAEISNTYARQTDLVSKSITYIKAYYISTAKNLASNYLSKLNECK
jgi:hypothetical protein